MREASLLLGLTESGAERCCRSIDFPVLSLRSPAFQAQQHTTVSLESPEISITNSYIYISNRYFTFVEFHFII